MGENSCWFLILNEGELRLNVFLETRIYANEECRKSSFLFLFAIFVTRGIRVYNIRLAGTPSRRGYCLGVALILSVTIK